MAVFDLKNCPNLSNGISAAEKRTKLSTQGAPQVCGCVRARTLPFFIGAGPLTVRGGAGASGRPRAQGEAAECQR